MCVFLSHDWSITPSFLFFNVFIRSFFRPLRSGRGSRIAGRIALFVLIARTSCVPVLLSMYLLFGHVGFIIHTYIYILKYINGYICVCIREWF